MLTLEHGKRDSDSAQSRRGSPTNEWNNINHNMNHNMWDHTRHGARTAYRSKQFAILKSTLLRLKRQIIS